MSRLSQGGSSSGGGGGGGAVDSVNTIGPDGGGNVSLTITDIPDLDSGLDAAGRITTVDDTSTGTTGTTGIDSLIESFGLGVTAADGSSDLQLPNATVVDSPLSIGQVGLAYWVNPAAPSGFRLVAIDVAVSSGSMVNGIQVVGLGNVTGGSTPNNQQSLSATGDGFASQGDFFFRRGSLGSCTQVLRFIPLLDVDTGSIAVVAGGGSINVSPTIPDLNISSITWVYASDTSDVSYDVPLAIEVDYQIFGNVDIATLGATIAACVHPPANGSKIYLSNQNSGSELGIYTYGDGMITPTNIDLSRGMVLTRQGMYPGFTDFAFYNGFLERNILLSVVGGLPYKQYLPNPILTPVIVGPNTTYPFSDSFQVWRLQPDGSGDSIVTLTAPHDTSTITGGRIFTFIDESDDPSHRSVIDASAFPISGLATLYVPFHGSVTIYADDVQDVWVIYAISPGPPPDSGTQTLQSVDGVIQWA